MAWLVSSYRAREARCASIINGSYETDAFHLAVSMALVVSTKQPFLVVHFRREAAEALKARNIPEASAKQPVMIAAFIAAKRQKR
ncbi:MAG: hypothetical protein PHT80_14205 [Lentisphaeria bacterium]|nr:hypothetical protein [Lentisphaeria bacterium]